MDNRSNILLCALRLFATRGYDAIGVQEIVEAAGITKPTLYHYFGSKQGLLDALLKEYFDQLYREVKAASVYRSDLPHTLNQVAKTYFDFANRNKMFCRLQLALWFAPPESDAFRAVSRLNHELYQLIEALFVRAAADHGNMKGRHRAYAATFVGMINNYISLSLNGYAKLDNRLLYQAVHQFMHGIFS
jgi:TetR/AcrR family transcriptional regulator